MVSAFSKRRMEENEAVFREYNETAIKRLQSAKQEEQKADVKKSDELKLHFYCECADENCQERIALKPSDYQIYHRERDQFIIINGHEVEEIEDILAQTEDFTVVRKHNEPPEEPGTLNTTPAQST
jgi:hypothetical protein